jgi:hypothetical protein
VRRGRQAIVELAEELERAGAVNPRGIVLARALLTDGRSPLFDRYSEQTVTDAAREVHEALAKAPMSPSLNRYRRGPDRYAAVTREGQ